MDAPNSASDCSDNKNEREASNHLIGLPIDPGWHTEHMDEDMDPIPLL